jgi:cholesterol transport system auxiliary component
MNFRRRTLRPRVFAIAALPLLLVACGGIFSDEPKRQLYRTASTFTFPAGLPRVGAQLLVAAPTAPAGLDSRRIALSRAPVSLDYFADAEWTDRAPFLVQDALVEGFQKSGAVPAVAADRGGLHADFVLDTVLDDFAATYDSADKPPRVRVAVNAKLVRMPERKIIAHASISHEQPAAANTMSDIVKAFDGALGGAAQEVVTWTVSNPALSEQSRSAR